MKFRKLNASGFAHHLALMLVVVTVGIGGCYMLYKSHADSLTMDDVYVTKQGRIFIMKADGQLKSQLPPSQANEVAAGNGKVAYTHSTDSTATLTTLSTATLLGSPTDVLNLPLSAGTINWPSLTADAKTLVFGEHENTCNSTCSNSYSDIFLAKFDGSRMRKLTSSNSTQQYRKPSVSPDGSKILYSYQSSAGQSSWYTMALDGTSKTPVPTIINNSDGIAPLEGAWSPDGKKIYFIESYSDSPVCKIESFDTVTNTVAHLVNTAGYRCESLSVSPDSLYLAYVAWIGNTSSNNKLYTIQTNGGTPREISNAVGYESIDWKY